MEIKSTTSGDSALLELRGRLDAYWADHVGNCIEQVIRGGAHQLSLNFAAVDYLSSAGLRVLLQFRKRLTAINGSLRLINPSEMVARTLSLSGFDDLLSGEVPLAPVVGKPCELTETEWGTYQVLDHRPTASFSCEIIGEPGIVNLCAQDARTVAFPETSLGLGLGAFGRNFEECRARFGEFVALGGAALSMPTDGSNIPDHVLTNAALVPELQVLYGLKASGQFLHALRFDCGNEPAANVTLPNLADLSLKLCNAPTVCLCIAAECGALVGAALRKSPTLCNGEDPLTFPAVRDWVTFTTERGSDRHVALIAGIVSIGPDAQLQPFLRPLGSGTQAQGHFHAAVFAYRPLPRGVSQLSQAVSALVGTESARGLLHLLADERPFEGVGESELFRGGLWMAPVDKVNPLAKT